MNKKNYISSTIKRFGPNFLVDKSQETLMKESPRLFKDLAYGSIAPNDYVDILTNDLLLEPCIIKAQRLYEEFYIYYSGVKFLYDNKPPTSNIELGKFNMYLAQLESKLRAYTYIIQAFNIVQQTRDVEPLTILSNQLKDLRGVL